MPSFQLVRLAQDVNCRSKEAILTQSFGCQVHHMIIFEMQVTNVEFFDHEAHTVWHVTTQNIRSGETTTNEYDAVLITSGHYSVPFIPDIAGLKLWNNHYPGVVSHSKLFRKPEVFRGKVFLLVELYVTAS